MACSSLRLLNITILVLLVFPTLGCADGRPRNRNKMKGRGPRWWGVVHPDETTKLVDSVHNNAISIGDANMPKLRKKQQRLLREHPGALTAIGKGLRMAILECSYQFRDRRWNCPIEGQARGKYLFGKIAQRGCRETAFIYSITSAGVAHAVSRACSEGIVSTCTCDYRQSTRPTGSDWEWGGCSDNIDFGIKFSRQFVDAAEKSRDHRWIMNLHNNEAGRTHVSSGMRRECKCHGMSGSCTVKTCWMRLPSFREVGNNLKDRFDGASWVMVNNQGSFRLPKKKYRFPLKPYNPDHKVPTNRDLVYYEPSPDFCLPNPKLGIEGTKGRTCNDTSIGVDGCDLMCCNRGYTTKEKEEVVRCMCTFQWCCEVECKYCKVKRLIHTCL